MLACSARPIARLLAACEEARRFAAGESSTARKNSQFPPLMVDVLADDTTAMRITHYEVIREPGGSRLAAYTVLLAGRQFVVTRRLGTPRLWFRDAEQDHSYQGGGGRAHAGR